MRKLRWQLLIAIGGLILVIGLLIRQTPDSEISSPQPIKGGVYSEALVGEIIRLNPILDTVNQPDRDAIEVNMMVSPRSIPRSANATARTYQEREPEAARKRRLAFWRITNQRAAHTFRR